MAVEIGKEKGGGQMKQEKAVKGSKGVSFIAKMAKEELSALSGLEPSTILGVVREGEEWMVTLEMVEKKSIPDAMDVLGVYEVRVDNDGQLLNFNRISLRKRGDTGV